MNYEFSYILKRYFQEFIEAFLSLTIVKIVMMQKLFKLKDCLILLKLSLMIAAVTLILEEINPENKNQLKNGILLAARTK